MTCEPLCHCKYDGICSNKENYRVSTKMAASPVRPLSNVRYWRKADVSDSGARHGVDARGPQHVGVERTGEQTGNGTIAHIQAAGIGAEGWQDQPQAVGDKTAAAYAAPPFRHPRTRMQVSRHFPRFKG